MKLKRFVIPVLGITALLATSTVFAASSLKSKATLLGSNEVPSVSSPISGKFDVKVDDTETMAEFKLKVKDATAVTAAHLHCAPAGQNGPIVAHLFGNIPGGFDVDGELAKFTLKDANIVTSAGCSPAINSIQDLADAIRAGNIYVNVHTVAHPGGEVRGQLSMP